MVNKLLLLFLFTYLFIYRPHRIIVILTITIHHRYW